VVGGEKKRPVVKREKRRGVRRGGSVKEKRGDLKRGGGQMGGKWEQKTPP